jgi:WD40 repeat protein
LRLVVGALSAGLVAIAIVALMAIDQRNTAERERNDARSRTLALRSAENLDTDPELALRLAVWADQITPTAQSATALRQAILASRQLAVLAADPLTADTTAYSPDGARIATGGEAGAVRVWDATSHGRVAQFAPKRGGVTAVRYSPDGTRLALGFSEGVFVTDAALGDPRELFRPRGGATVNRIAFSRDGATVAVALSDGSARLIDVASGSTTTTLAADGAAAAINGIDMDGAGHVVTADGDGVVKLWADGVVTRRLGDADSAERDVRFSPDGSRVLAVGDDGQARLWDARTGEVQATITVGPRYLSSAAFSRDGSRFATVGWDGAVRIWSTAGASQLLVLRGQLSRVLDVSFDPAGDRVVTVGDDGSARIWDASGVQAFGGPAITDNIDFSPSGRWIVSSEDGTLRVRDPLTGRVHQTQAGPAGYTQARFSPAADELVILRDETKSLYRWSLNEPGERLLRRFPKATELASARFDPTGRRIIYATAKGPVVVHDLQSGRDILLRGAPKDVLDVVVLPDGKHAVASAAGGQVLVWRLDSPAHPIRRMTGHRGDINTLGASRDGHIVTAGSDRTVRVWNPLTGHQVVLRGHTDEVSTAVFTPDGKRVLSASADGTLRLWDARGGAALAVLQASEQPLYDVAIRRDGLIATLDGHQVVHVFRCRVCGPLSQLRAQARALHPRPLTAGEQQRFLAD